MEGEGVSIRERNRVNKVTPSQANSLADGTPHARLWAQMELLSSPSHREEAAYPQLCLGWVGPTLWDPWARLPSACSQNYTTRLCSGVFHLEA